MPTSESHDEGRGGAANTPGVNENSDSPKRTLTESSYYDCDGVLYDADNPNAQDWHYARDVRAQVEGRLPRPGFKSKKHPSHFGNKGDTPLSLSASKPLTHVPITPRSSKPYSGGDPGAHRAVYNDKDRSKIDVIYHDPRKPKRPGGKYSQFSKAKYVPRSANKPLASVQIAPETSTSSEDETSGEVRLNNK